MSPRPEDLVLAPPIDLTHRDQPEWRPFLYSVFEGGGYDSDGEEIAPHPGGDYPYRLVYTQATVKRLSLNQVEAFLQEEQSSFSDVIQYQDRIRILFDYKCQSDDAPFAYDSLDIFLCSPYEVREHLPHTHTEFLHQGQLDSWNVVWDNQLDIFDQFDRDRFPRTETWRELYYRRRGFLRRDLIKFDGFIPQERLNAIVPEYFNTHYYSQ